MTDTEINKIYINKKYNFAKKTFLIKSNVIIQHSCIRGRYTVYSDIPTFHIICIVRFAFSLSFGSDNKFLFLIDCEFAAPVSRPLRASSSVLI